MKTRLPRAKFRVAHAATRLRTTAPAIGSREMTPMRHAVRVWILIVAISMCAAMASGQVIDDFESYLDSNDIKGFWKFADLDTNPAHAFDGTQSLIRGGSNVSPNSGWSAWATYVDPFLDLAPADGIHIRARRTLGSLDVQFRLSTLDSMSQRCEVFSAAGHPPGAWVLLSIEFADCPLFNPSEITQILVSVTNVSSESGDVYGNFDRLEVFFSIFRDGFESGDLAAWQPPPP